MAKKRNLRHFESLSENLRSLASEAKGLVACPICLRVFDVRDYNNGRLTHGHILPDSIGGRSHTLVCAQCNSFCGSNQDAHLKRYVIYRRGVPQGSEARLRAVIAGKEVNATLRPNEAGAYSKYTIVLHPKSPPDEAEAVARYLKDLEPDDPMKLTLEFGFDLHHVKVAFLTAAYLEAFRRMGYWYILNENLDEVRDQIVHPAKAGVADAAWIEWSRTLRWEPELFFVTSLAEFRCVGFSFGGITSLLPIAEDREGDIYRRISVMDKAMKKMAVLWPPFREIVDIPRNMRAGRIAMETEDEETVAMLSHPDLKTVRRILSTVDEHAEWMLVAPGWAHSG